MTLNEHTIGDWAIVEGFDFPQDTKLDTGWRMWLCGLPNHTTNGRSTPVEEIDATSSGVEVKETSTNVAAVPWPTWRGADNSGLATGQEAVTTWCDEDNIVWRVDVPGRGHGSPIVTEKLVLLASALDAEQKQLVIAYNRADGSIQWEKALHEGSFPTAKELHKKASKDGKVVKDPPHGEGGYYPHYHDKARSGGHSFYGDPQ